MTSPTKYTRAEIYEDIEEVFDRLGAVEALLEDEHSELNARIEALERILRYNELATPSQGWLEEEKKRHETETATD